MSTFIPLLRAGLVASLSWFLFVPWGGWFVLAYSPLFTLCVLHAFQRPFIVTKILAVSVFALPLHALWPTLISAFRNTKWFEGFSTLWALPLVLFAAAAIVLLADTTQKYAASSSASLDSSLRDAWKEMIFNARTKAKAVLSTGGALLILLTLTELF